MNELTGTFWLCSQQFNQEMLENHDIRYTKMMHMISDFEFVTRPSFKTGGEFPEAVRNMQLSK